MARTFAASASIFGSPLFQTENCLSALSTGPTLVFGPQARELTLFLMMLASACQPSGVWSASPSKVRVIRSSASGAMSIELKSHPVYICGMTTIDIPASLATLLPTLHLQPPDDAWVA